MDEETGLYYYGARYYNPRESVWLSVDPKAEKAVGRSPYEYCFSNPIIFVDPDGEWPWPIYVRSFISAPRAGTSGLAKKFRGDGRAASVGDSYKDLMGATSRAGLKFTYDSDNHRVDFNNVIADYTVKYDSSGKESARKMPSVKKNVSDLYSNGVRDVFSIDYMARDPLTPSVGTPFLEVVGHFDMKESGDNLSIIATFYGEGFPSTEAFIEDQSGSRLFLGADKEKGSILTLFGGPKKNIITVNMNVKIDKNGNFVGVRKSDGSGDLISVGDWNKDVQDNFK